MANANRVALDQLGDAIARDLRIYEKSVNDKIYKAGHKAVKELERKTKDTAPFNARAYHAHYTDYITTKSEQMRTGESVHTWYVKPPCHRLTHLLVHGHATRDGGRTRADPFLQNALDSVLPDYEQAVEEALKSGN